MLILSALKNSLYSVVFTLRSDPKISHLDQKHIEISCNSFKNQKYHSQWKFVLALNDPLGFLEGTAGINHKGHKTYKFEVKIHCNLLY